MLIESTLRSGRTTFRLLALTLLALGLSAGAVQAGPVSVVQNFAGLSTFDDVAVNAGTFFIPPDQGSAVGPNHYMQMVNLVTAVYNKDGTVAMPRQSLGTFFANAGVTGLGTNLSDPRLVYDQGSQRWFTAAITTESNTNSIVLAVSQTSDPTGAWKATKFTANTTANNFADYPTIGVDKNALYIATNNFMNGTTFDGTTLTTIPKANLLNPLGPDVSNKTRFDVPSGGTSGTTPATLAPVSAFDNRSNGVIISTDDFFPMSILHRFSVLNPGSNAPTLSADNPIVVPTYWNNQNSHQPDGTRDLNGVDFRIGSNNVYQVGDILWAAQSILTTAVTGNSVYNAIRWYEINATTNTLLQSGTISDPHHDYIFPSIAANAAGNVIIGFSATGDSTTSDFPGSWFVAGTTIGGVTTFDVAQQLRNGFGNNHLVDDDGRNRWGDYSAISVDPNDPNAFWIGEEVAIQGSSRVPVVWGTQISELVFASAVPEPASLALLILGLACIGISRRPEPRKLAAARRRRD